MYFASQETWRCDVWCLLSPWEQLAQPWPGHWMPTGPNTWTLEVTLSERAPIPTGYRLCQHNFHTHWHSRTGGAFITSQPGLLSAPDLSLSHHNPLTCITASAGHRDPSGALHGSHHISVSTQVYRLPPRTKPETFISKNLVKENYNKNPLPASHQQSVQPPDLATREKCKWIHWAD